MILNEFYESIMLRLTTKIPSIKKFDLYFGQDRPQTEEEELPFNRPAVFFEFIPLNFETLGNKRQDANIQFKLHVLHDVVQEVDNNTTISIRNKGHEHLQMLDSILFYLQGYNKENFYGSISRVGLETYEPNGLMIKHALLFKTRLTDNAAKGNYKTPDPLPDLVKQQSME